MYITTFMGPYKLSDRAYKFVNELVVYGVETMNTETREI